ncbi:MAG: DHH family phosphoesterase, partial [Candidatus Aenigmatarchaeota archaeon]
IAKYEIEAAGEITFFEVKSRYGISGLLNTKLFDLYPKRTLILYRKKPGGMWSVSARSHKYDVGAAMKKAAEGLGTGGGHPVAAGAYVKDFKLFKKRLLELLK